MNVDQHSTHPAPEQRLVAVVGPTAVGKTALASALAHALGGEIVNADSRQVYRGMRIGTAAPTADELAAAPHHLYSFLDPDAPFSLAVYQELATDTIKDIAARGNVPLLVGGTGQYVAAVLEGWTVPRVPPQPDIRARLEGEAAKHGTAALFTRLEQIDPQAAATIQPNNLRRIIRALEVYEITGEPISAQQHKTPPPYQITTLWLTLPRVTLYTRIDGRVDAMMGAGLLRGVQDLLRRGYGWELPAMSSLGYKEFRPYFEGTAPLDACVERLKFNTHAFARKQDMWFRRLPNVVQLDAAHPDLIHHALAAVR